MASQRTVDVDLTWSENSPMASHFWASTQNEKFPSDWVTIEPPLLQAEICSHSVVSFDISPSPHDNAMRWRYKVQINDDKSAVCVHIWRWSDTVPQGLLIRVVVDNMQAEMQRLVGQVNTLRAAMDGYVSI